MLARAVTEGWMRRGLLVALATAGLAAAGCGGGGGGDSAPAASNAGSPGGSADGGGSSGGSDPGSGTPGEGSASLKISGTPGTQAAVGNAYSFKPDAEADAGDSLAFSIQNRPAWASFSTVTGMLEGTPQAEHLGEHGDIVIVVSDGDTQASLPAFTITVAAADSPGAGSPDPAAPVPPGAVTLQWTAPTLSTAGEALTDLAGYRIHYGKSEAALTHTIEVDTVGTSTFMVENLAPGTYYFAVRAYTSSGDQSPLSNIQTVVIS